MDLLKKRAFAAVKIELGETVGGKHSNFHHMDEKVNNRRSRETTVPPGVGVEGKSQDREAKGNRKIYESNTEKRIHCELW